MHIIYILAIIAAAAILFLLARQQKPPLRTPAFIVAFIVPALALLFFIFYIYPQSRPPAPTSESAKEAVFYEKLAKEEVSLQAQFDSNPADVQTAMALSQTLMEQTKYDAAVTVLNTALKQNPEHKDLTRQLGVAYFTRGLFLAEQKKDKEALDSLIMARNVTAGKEGYNHQLDMFIKIIGHKLDPEKYPLQAQKKAP